ncbi:hypothetical protein [Nocardiopsis composta]|uniref:Uncharacterized protein n=1 Tax=Nocardiopsis composta TaxID=157465 RepID=A0A7W8QLZ8_9ACTN|nr:hypothetical protein [Nocardiopsis composta]MBB5432796.1 hypothetical protein [Nocardiopsis composta]
MTRDVPRGGESRPRAAALRAAPWLVGAAAGALALGPGLGRGYLLRYDMVFVPDPPLGPVQLGAGEGFPRAVPSDAVAALLSRLLPADVVQTLLLLAVFAIGAAGAARLVPAGPGRAQAPRLAAALFYAWNPFLAERLLLGQWAVLLGYAGLPWVLAAAVRLGRRRGFARFVVALLPAAVGGFSSAVLSALVALPAAAAARLRTVPAAAAGIVLVSLPWLLPALGSGARTDPAAVGLFAARADTPFGAAGSLLSLGGIWNARAVPELYGHPALAALRLVLSLAALAGWVWLLRGGRLGAAGRGLSTAAAAGFGVALLGTAEPGRELLRWLIEAWPGFGPLRDGQLYVAPLALLQAVGLGGAAAWLHGAEGEGRAGPVAAALLACAPVVLLPGLLWGAGGKLVPVDYPAEWGEVRRIVDGDPDPGSVLVLPWSAYRGLDWAGGGRTVVVLDPAAKLFERRTVWNDDLRVAEDGEVRTVRGEDPAARAAARLAAEGRADAASLGALGVRYVLVEREALPDTASEDPLGENKFLSDPDSFDQVHEGPRLALYRIPDLHVEAVKEGISGLEVTGWSATVGSIICSLAASGSNLVPVRPPRPPGNRSRKETPT